MKRLIVTSFCVAVFAAAALADDFTWVGPSGDWGDVANWYNATVAAPATRLPGYPNPGNDWAVVDSGVGTGPTVSATMNNVNGILTGNGDITIQNGAYVGCKANGFIAYDAGDVSVVTVQPGGTFTLDYATNVTNKGAYIGRGGDGTLDLSGTFYTNWNTYIGSNDTAVGTLNVHDGAVYNQGRGGNFSFIVGQGGEGTINIDGGQISMAGSRLDLGVYNSGAYTNSRGHIEMSGGQILAKHLYMEINALTLQAGGPVDVRGTIHQTGGEFLFADPDQVLAINRVNQAIAQGWWTTDPGLSLNVWQDLDGTHVTVIPEPATLGLLGLGGLVLLRRRRA